MCANFQGKKKCVKLLKFAKPFSDKKLQSISFWQLERIYIYIFIYMFVGEKKNSGRFVKKSKQNKKISHQEQELNMLKKI